MAAPGRYALRWALALIALVAAGEIAYVLSANVLLRSDVLPRLLNRDPDRLYVEWSNALSVIPGRFSAEKLELSGGSAGQRWSVSAAAAQFQVALWRLPFKTLHIGLLRADTVALSLRTQPGEPDNEGASAPPAPGPAPSASGDPTVAGAASEAPLTDAGWNIRIGELDLSRIRALELDEYRLAGIGALAGERINLLPTGDVTSGRVRLRLDSSTLSAGTESIAQELQLEADLRLDTLLARRTRVQEAARSMSGTVEVSGRAASYAFLDRYLTAARWLHFGGHGDLRATLRIERGKLVEGSELAVDSPRLAVELDAPAARGKDDRYRVEGAGRMRSAIVSADGAPQTRLQVELRDMEVRQGPEDIVFVMGKAFRLTASGPPIELGSPPVEPAVVVELEDTIIPDVAALTRYVPGTPPFSLTSGSARLAGRLEYADGAVTGSLNLAGERVAGSIFGKAAVGELDVALVIKEADLRSSRLDLSGSRVRMQAAQEDGRGRSPLTTEIKVLEARLAASSPGDSIAPATTDPPPIDGVVRLEGSVANTDFLSDFLPDDSGLELAGDGRMSAELRLETGRLAPGSRVEVTSERLMSRFLDLEATGSGLVQGEIRSGDTGPEVFLKVGLRDMDVLRPGDGRVVLKGDVLELTASGRATDLDATLAEPRLTMVWQNAVVPDVAVLNTYLAGLEAFGLRSGVARASGRLGYGEHVLSGNLDLAGERIEGTVFGEAVTGRLDLALHIKRADPNARQLDLSGTRVQMQATPSGKGGKRPASLRSEIQFPQARFESALSLAELRERSGPLPINGVIRAEGTVTNIDVINRFLSGKHRIGFGGDGRLSADLRVSGGRLAPGSALEIRSDRLGSRFLDFEAKGAGLLKARVRGRPPAPNGEIEVRLSDFTFRRLDEATPYIQGKRLDLKTAGKRLDKDNVLRELDTDIELWAAEIPDMTVYNRYLPQDSGVSILSGKGIVEGDFRLQGVSGSGYLELRAKGVDVRVADQTLTGDLRITTRLRDGNLDEMRFDASGTRLRIDKGTLVGANGTEAHGWWGQIDIEEGQMTWRQPLQLDALVGLKLRDSGLLVNLFVKDVENQQWLNDLLTIRNVTGKGRVVIRDDSLTLQDARIAGENVLVLANARMRGEQVQGGLYAKYGVVSGGIEVIGDETIWRLLNAREWFEGHAKAFSTPAE